LAGSKEHKDLILRFGGKTRPIPSLRASRADFKSGDGDPLSFAEADQRLKAD